LRVLWIGHAARIGGSELALLEAVHGLNLRGHEGHVVLPAEGELGSRLEGAAEVDVIPHNPWAGGARSLRTLVRGLAYDILVARKRISELAVRVKADLVISNTITVCVGGPAAREAGIPHVWQICEIAPEHNIRFLIGRRLTFSLMRRYAVGFLVNSETTRSWYSSALPADRIHVLDYAVETPDPLPAQRPPDGPFQLILVGQKSRAKGQHEAIDALGKLISDGLDVELTLLGAGEPDYESELKARARRLGVDARVRFVGYDPNPAALVSTADVALTCSRWEAFGRTTVEAMKLGKPVVGADLGGTAELIRDGENGLLYEPGDVDQLAAHIAHLYRDRETARRMGARGRAWARERFTLSNYGAQLERALTQLLGSGDNRTVP
jgi:glycosyltransferase involved in cell wall biosynthesis